MRILTARERVEMLAPWRRTAGDGPVDLGAPDPDDPDFGHLHRPGHHIPGVI